MLNLIRSLVGVIGISFVLSACGQEGGAATAAAPQVYDINALLAAADPVKGKVQFLQCRACHSTEQGGANKVGPNLHGVIGRKAGTAPGFNYSPAMSGATIIWSPETLDKWIARPSDFLPGTAMVFVGIPKPEDRANLIAYVQQETR